MTVRLPGTLHDQLTALAEREGIAFDEIEAVMAERDQVEPEAGLSPVVTRRLQERRGVRP